MQVRQPVGDGERDLGHLRHVDRGAIEVIEQGAVFVEVRHQPQLRPRPAVCERKNINAQNAGYMNMIYAIS